MIPLAGCGHALEKRDGTNEPGHALALRAWSRDRRRSVSYQTVCPMCRQDRIVAGVVLLDRNEEDAWLAGQGPDDQPSVQTGYGADRLSQAEAIWGPLG